MDMNDNVSASSASTPRVLVLGASGLLGRAVHRALLDASSAGGATFRVLGTGHRRAEALGLQQLDVTDSAALRSFLQATRPTVVINCVAERRPDQVERDEAAARQLNVHLVSELAEIAASQGASPSPSSSSPSSSFFLLHISTDYVFDGSSPPYAPSAAPHPLNAYGRHKLEAEEAIRKHPSLAAGAWLILRVPVLFGQSQDLAESSITALAADVLAADKPKRVDDWSARYATNTADVAEVITRIVARGCSTAGGGGAGFGGFVSGTHHFSSKERAAGGRPYTKFSIACLIGDVLGKPTAHLTADPDPPAGGAARPKDCELDVGSLAAALGVGTGELPQTPLREGLAAVLGQILL